MSGCAPDALVRFGALGFEVSGLAIYIYIIKSPKPYNPHRILCKDQYKFDPEVVATMVDEAGSCVKEPLKEALKEPLKGHL